jgi:hypothetical protein
VACAAQRRRVRHGVSTIVRAVRGDAEGMEIDGSGRVQFLRAVFFIFGHI